MLQFKKILLFFLGVFISVSVFAGGSGGGGGLGTPTSPAPNCAVNPAAGNTCATATPICDLNGYCGSTSASYTADYWPQLNSAFCGSIENNSFLIFTASATSMTFNVWITSSSTGDGIQIMVFSAAGNCSGAVTSYVCWSPGTATAGPTAVTANGLTPGNNYYIMIDGFAGDVSNYVIGIASGAVLPVNVASSLSGGQTICLGQSATLTAGGGNGTYTWDNTVGISGLTGSSVSVTPPSEGTFEYTVHSVSGSTLCPSSNQATATVQVVNCSCSITASNSGDICPGGSANLTATNVPDATSYSWTGPNGFTASGENVLAISPPTAPGTYDYIVTATVPAGTCASTTTIEVLAPPAVTVPNDTTVCNSSIIPASNFNNMPATSYAWTNSSPSIGLAASGTGNVPSFTAVNTGTATVTATITVTPTLNGCVGTPVTYTITVAPVPVMNTVSNISQCQGSTVNGVPFSSTLTGIVYDWTNSNTASGLAASGTGNIPSFAATNTGSTAITSLVSVTPSLATCTGTPLTFNITINPLPTVVAGVSQTVCAGAPVTLSGSGAATYTWTNGVTNNSAFTANTTQTYTVTGTDANGCQNTDNVSVVVNPLPPVNAGIDQVICIGDAPVTLTASGATTYTWSNGVANGVPFSPTSTITYTVTGVDANNCQNTDQVVVTVNPLPAINAGADQSICVGTSVILSGSGGVIYVWTNGGVDGQSFVPAIGAHTYSVTGTDANGCVNTDAVTITVLPVPVAGFTQDVTQGYPGLVVNFINTSSNSTSYLWDFGTGFPSQSTSLTQTHAYSGVGTYGVILQASNGICSDTALGTVIVLPFPPPEIHVPNVFTPNGDNSNDVYWIDVKYGASIAVQIFNRWGDKMHEMNDFSDRWDGKVNGNDASDGVYFFKYTVVGINGSTVQGHGHLTIER